MFTRGIAVVISRTWEIVEHEPPSRQTSESTSGPFPTTLAYRLSDQEGGPRVEFSVTGRPTGLLRLLQPLLARNTQRNLDENFPRLKRVLEAETASLATACPGGWSSALQWRLAATQPFMRRISAR